MLEERKLSSESYRIITEPLLESPEILSLPSGSDEEEMESNIARHELEKLVPELLKTLSDREAGVLKRRFGLEGFSPMTLDEVGAAYGVTRERIRQIEAKALRKLKHPSKRYKLDDYNPKKPIKLHYVVRGKRYVVVPTPYELTSIFCKYDDDERKWVPRGGYNGTTPTVAIQADCPKCYVTGHVLIDYERYAYDRPIRCPLCKCMSRAELWRKNMA